MNNRIIFFFKSLFKDPNHFYIHGRRITKLPNGDYRVRTKNKTQSDKIFAYMEAEGMIDKVTNDV